MRPTPRELAAVGVGVLTVVGVVLLFVAYPPGWWGGGGSYRPKRPPPPPSPPPPHPHAPPPPPGRGRDRKGTQGRFPDAGGSLLGAPRPGRRNLPHRGWRTRACCRLPARRRRAREARPAPPPHPGSPHATRARPRARACGG